MRKSVTAELSDAAVLTRSAQSPLVTIQHPVVDPETGAEQETKELPVEEKGLIRYVQWVLNEIGLRNRVYTEGAICVIYREGICRPTKQMHPGGLTDIGEMYEGEDDTRSWYRPISVLKLCRSRPIISLKKKAICYIPAKTRP